MLAKQKIVLVIVAILQCVCLCFMLMGITGGFDTAVSSPDSDEFHVDKVDKDTRNNGSATLGDAGLQVPEKVVLVVIDALRLDFMSKENFPFLMGSLRQYQSTTLLKFDVKVDSPTVTLPRVKTLVTGKSPVYLDVLRNFQASHTSKGKQGINQPNLIENLRMELPDMNICFFGDETWLRLFPSDNEYSSPYFKKWEGVTSFFVKDFYEVDNNVTRHLENIDDCNLLILHYLGLDHIGHVHGPKQTDLLKKKLHEMDHVIQHLHSHLSHLKRSKSKNLIMITGDHGMANVGGHGGSSVEEVMTPLVSLVIGGISPHHSQLETSQIQQIDIAPTLAAIWNVRIPRDSRGQLILDLIEHFKPTDQLADSYHRNCKHLLNALGTSRKAATYKLWLSEITKMETPLAIKKYIELEQELSSTLQNAKTRNTDLLISFVVSMVILICMQLYIFSYLGKIVGKHVGFAAGLMFLPGLVIFFSSSFIEEEHYLRYYLYPALLIIHIVTNPRKSVDDAFTMIKLLVLHRFAIMLNQTGDKWSHLPDLNDVIEERNLQWLTSTVAVILVYVYSEKTVKRSRIFKSALLSVYIMKLIVHYVNESSRGEIHWFLMDSKLQKLTFLLISVHFVNHFHQGHVYSAISSSLTMFFMCLQRCHNLIVVALVLVQADYLSTLILRPSDESQRIDKTYKSSVKRNSIISRLLVVWFFHASFYYQGNSNGLATVDVHAGYIGIESYSSNVLIGSFIFMNTFFSSILGYLTVMKREGYEPTTMMNGSAHVPNHTTHKAKGKSKEKTNIKKSSEWLPLLILLSNGAECIVYSCSIIIFQNHLFIWSVFVPKLLYLITQCVACIIASTLYLFIM